MHYIRKAPMIFFSALLVSGICAGHYLNVSVYILLITLAIFIPFCFLNKFRFVSLSAIFLSLFILGAVLITSYERYIPENDISNYAEGHIVTIEGRADSYLDKRDDRSYLYIKPGKIIDGDVVRYVRGRVRTTIYNFSGDIPYGDNIVITGRLVLPRGRTNPGGFDYKGWLSSRSVSALLYVNKIDSVSSGWGNPLIKFSYWLREKAVTCVDRFAGGSAGALLKGMLIGERESIPENIQEDFRKSGVIHIIAISGQNLSLVGFATFLILSVFGLSKRTSAIIVIPVIVLYSIMTGFDPPVVRAMIMGILVLLALILELRVSLLNIIGTAMLIFLLFNPKMLFDVGFQLSFAATLGIAVLYRPISGLMRSLPAFIKEMISATLSAQIGVIPLLIYYFYNISLVSLIANMIIIPLSSISMVIGFTGLILSFPVSFVGTIFGEISGQISGIIIYLTHIFSSFHWSSISIPKPGVELIVFIYASVILLVLFFTQSLRKVSALIFCGFIGIYGFGLALKPSSPDMRLTFLSVGDGRAVVLEEHEKCYVMDCGSKSGGDNAYNTVKSYLNMRGIKNIDTLIISHPHSDHINGISKLLSNFLVNNLYSIPYPYPSNTYIEMLGSIKGDTRFWTTIGDFTIFRDSNFSIRFFAPLCLPPVVNEGNYPGNDAMNSSSIVNIIRFKGLSIYLPSDNEDLFNEIYDYYQIMEFPHHGSKNANIWQFVNVSLSKVVILSSGKLFEKNYENIKNMSDGMGVYLMSTGEGGAITVEVTGSRCIVKSEY
jgi:competence protein ComEC